MEECMLDILIPAHILNLKTADAPGKSRKISFKKNLLYYKRTFYNNTEGKKTIHAAGIPADAAPAAFCTTRADNVQKKAAHGGHGSPLHGESGKKGRSIRQRNQCDAEYRQNPEQNRFCVQKTQRGDCFRRIRPRRQAPDLR